MGFWGFGVFKNGSSTKVSEDSQRDQKERKKKKVLFEEELPIKENES